MGTDVFGALISTLIIFAEIYSYAVTTGRCGGNHQPRGF
jgi:hypothetical protein